MVLKVDCSTVTPMSRETMIGRVIARNNDGSGAFEFLDVLNKLSKAYGVLYVNATGDVPVACALTQEEFDEFIDGLTCEDTPYGWYKYEITYSEHGDIVSESHLDIEWQKTYKIVEYTVVRTQRTTVSLAIPEDEDAEDYEETALSCADYDAGDLYDEDVEDYDVCETNVFEEQVENFDVDSVCD